MRSSESRGCGLNELAPTSRIGHTDSVTDSPTSTAPAPNPAEIPTDPGAAANGPQPAAVSPAPVSGISAGDHAAALASIESLQARLAAAETADRQRSADVTAHDHAGQLRTLEEQITTMQSERDRATTAAAESSERARSASILAHLATTGAGLVKPEYLAHAPAVEFGDGGLLTDEARTTLEAWRKASPELFSQRAPSTSPLATGTTGAPGSDLTDVQRRGLERIGVKMGDGHWSTRQGSRLALDLLNHSQRNRS